MRKIQTRRCHSYKTQMFLITFLHCFFLQITTDVGCICRWTWMGESQEVMLRHLTVSIRRISSQQIAYLALTSIHKRQWIIWGLCINLIFIITISVFSGLLQLKSVKPGHVIIKGPSSSLFLCMDSEGNLKGQVSYNTENWFLLFCITFYQILTIF